MDTQVHTQESIFSLATPDYTYGYAGTVSKKLSGLRATYFEAAHSTTLEHVRNNPFGAFDLGPHELGHFIFILLDEFMTIAGGSIF